MIASMMTECQLRIMIAALLRGTVGRLAHGMGAEALPACRIKPQTNRIMMTRYDVICPSAPWENDTTDKDRAWDLCYSLSEEYGYAQIRCNGLIVGDYTNGQ